MIHVRVFMYMDDLWSYKNSVRLLVYVDDYSCHNLCANFNEHKFYVVFIVLSSVDEMRLNATL